MPARALASLLLFAVAILGSTSLRAAPVWKVTKPGGGTLFLGGSMHALRPGDHQIPAAFESTLAKCDRVVFEVEDATKKQTERLKNAGQYPKGDSLKKHVDPRTYAYVVKVYGLLGVPEATVKKYRPWALTLFFASPSLHGFSSELGVEERLARRARAQKKPVTGLVRLEEHMGVFTGLSDRQSEAVLLLTFIPVTSLGYEGMMKAWRRGDADLLWRESRKSYAEYPAFGERILEARNRLWMPKIERFLASGETYFVVVGAAHMGGPQGLIPLLRQRGYRVEQL